VAGPIRLLPVDERYLLAATRYVELNPVRAGMVADPEAYPWSSAAAHIAGTGDALVKVKPLLEMVGNWRDFLLSGISVEELDRIRRHERTGRPLGDDGFVETLEQALGRILHRQRPGRKKDLRQQ
jgi:putative transposase